jgi:asparagine synthase (glutamine-hydrolysing)
MTDRMSMAHGLEVRVPLLDHELVEYVASIPPEIKIRRLTKKYILRRVAEGLLPKELMRKGKRGFSIPLAFWFRHQLKDFVLRVLSPSRVAEMGYFHPKKVSELIQEHMAARANHENKIWALVVFSLWHEAFAKGSHATADLPS